MGAHLLTGLCLFLGFLLLEWLAALAVLRLRVTGQRLFWQRWNAIRAPGQALYIALGDSTAQGIGAGAPKNSYPMLILRWLEGQTKEPLKLVNLSVSGARLQDLLDTQIQALKWLGYANVVTVCIGANDISDFHPKQFAQDLDRLVKALPPGSYVANIPAFTGRRRRLDPTVVRANKLIKKAVSGSKHYHVDMYQATKNNRSLSDFAADLFHPSARAYLTWATAFEKVMTDHSSNLFTQKTRPTSLKN